MAAAEWRTGMDTRANTAEMICASRNVQVPCGQLAWASSHQREYGTAYQMRPTERGNLERKVSRKIPLSYGVRQTLEEACGLVETPLEAVKKMNVEFLVLVDVLADALQDDHLHKPLNDERLG